MVRGCCRQIRLSLSWKWVLTDHAAVCANWVAWILKPTVKSWAVNWFGSKETDHSSLDSRSLSQVWLLPIPNPVAANMFLFTVLLFSAITLDRSTPPLPYISIKICSVFLQGVWPGDCWIRHPWARQSADQLPNQVCTDVLGPVSGLLLEVPDSLLAPPGVQLHQILHHAVHRSALWSHLLAARRPHVSFCMFSLGFGGLYFSIKPCPRSPHVSSWRVLRGLCVLF